MANMKFVLALALLALIEQQVASCQFLSALMGQLDQNQEDPTHQLVRRQQGGATGPVQVGGGGFDQGGLLSGLNNLAQQAQAMTQAQQLVQSFQNMLRPRSSLAQSPGQTALETAQSTSASALSGAAQTAQTAQTGGMSTLAELSAGLQRIAQNNPNLVPDLRALYQRISSQMNGATGQAANAVGQVSNQVAPRSNANNIVPANNQFELADNLAKVAVPGLQIGQQPPQAGFYPNLFQNPFQAPKLN